MFTNSIIAATGALLTLVAAVPMADQHPHHHHHPAHKRDYVWVTHTEVAIETVPVTKTVWIEPGETPPTHHKKPEPYSAPASSSSSSSSPAPPAYTPPASSSSSSAPPPPAYTPPAAPTTPTSSYVAPAYTPPAPSTPTTYAAPSSSSAPAAPASSPASSGGSSSGLSGMAAPGTYYTGDLTWYDVGLGACGMTSTASEDIVAIPEKIFDAYTVGGNPNKNPLCGKYVTITGKDGSPYKAKIVDRCPGCTENDLDLSSTFFNKVTQNGDGRVHGMKWCFD